MSMEQNENGQQEEMMNVEKTVESASEHGRAWPARIFPA